MRAPQLWGIGSGARVSLASDVQYPLCMQMAHVISKGEVIGQLTWMWAACSEQGSCYSEDFFSRDILRGDQGLVVPRRTAEIETDLVGRLCHFCRVRRRQEDKRVPFTPIKCKDKMTSMLRERTKGHCVKVQMCSLKGPW